MPIKLKDYQLGAAKWNLMNSVKKITIIAIKFKIDSDFYYYYYNY